MTIWNLTWQICESRDASEWYMLSCKTLWYIVTHSATQCYNCSTGNCCSSFPKCGNFFVHVLYYVLYYVLCTGTLLCTLLRSLYRYFIMYKTHHAHTQHNIIYNSLQNTGRNPLDLGKTSQQLPGPSFWKGLPRVTSWYMLSCDTLWYIVIHVKVWYIVIHVKLNKYLSKN